MPAQVRLDRIMEQQESDAEHDHEQRQRHSESRYEYGRSFMARTFGSVIDRLRNIETAVNTSTFGRVFRLDGSGHVRSLRFFFLGPCLA